MEKGLLIVLSGPSGSGKGTLLSDLRQRHPDVFYSISATTRAPREGLEEDGVHYYFLTHEKFEEMISENAFIEYKRYCGNIYGTAVLSALQIRQISRQPLQYRFGNFFPFHSFTSVSNRYKNISISFCIDYIRAISILQVKFLSIDHAQLVCFINSFFRRSMILFSSLEI